MFTVIDYSDKTISIFTVFNMRACFTRSSIRFASRKSLSLKKTTAATSSTQFSTFEPRDPILDVVSFQKKLAKYAPYISKSLAHQGYYTTPESFSILPKEIIQIMRQQSIDLRNQGRFEQSWSEKIDAVSGTVTRFDKEGVFACEPDGSDYDTAPDLIMYMTVLLQTLPDLLNISCDEFKVKPFGLSVSSFNAKLAVTSPGGSVYPLHIDNTQGIPAGDTRKLTCIMYLNPEYKEGDGGELRIFSGKHESHDLTPDGGRMVLFWSDEIPHEVLPTAPDADTMDQDKDRYALTLWIPTEDLQTIHNPRSKFASLREKVFPSK